MAVLTMSMVGVKQILSNIFFSMHRINIEEILCLWSKLSECHVPYFYPNTQKLHLEWQNLDHLQCYWLFTYLIPNTQMLHLWFKCFTIFSHGYWIFTDRFNFTVDECNVPLKYYLHMIYITSVAYVCVYYIDVFYYLNENYREIKINRC